MKYFLFVALLWTVFGIRARAAETLFTAQITAADGTVTAALLQRQKSFETESKLVRINPQTLHWSAIALPPDARDRQVLALFRAGKELLVLTQRTVEQGDDPSLYAYSAGKWRRLSEARCPVVLGAHLNEKKLELDCEEEDESGKTVSVKRALSLKNATVSKPVDLKLDYEESKTLPLLLQADSFYRPLAPAKRLHK